MPQKVQLIKAVINFRRLSAEGVLSASTNLYTGIFSNPKLTPPETPPPPVDAATLKAANDNLAAANAAALDGGKKALAARKQAKEAVVKLVTQLVHFVEANCKDDMQTFISSGLTPVASKKSQALTVSEKIRKLEPGKQTGEMTFTVVKDADAAIYQMQYGPVPVGATMPTTWTTLTLGSNVRVPTVISGLTPGTNYVFQVRAGLRAGGFSDWSDPITRMAM